MFCTNCFHRHTSVVNSRPHRARPSVWRRRKCMQCGTIFTTIERPSLSKGVKVMSNGKHVPFNLGRLTVSIAASFDHAPLEGKEHAMALAETVEVTLSSQLREISVEDIEAVTHQILRRFDEVAALQYAAKHRLIVSSRKRGRPSIVSSS